MERDDIGAKMTMFIYVPTHAHRCARPVRHYDRGGGDDARCWHLRAAAARSADFDIFARNIVIGGGLLMLMGMGSGRFAISKPAGGETRLPRLPSAADAFCVPPKSATTLPLGDLLCNPERCVHEQGAGKGQGRQRFESIREIG